MNHHSLRLTKLANYVVHYRHLFYTQAVTKFQGYNQPGPGMLYNTEKSDWEEANVWERERLMGFDNGDACAPGISENTRKAMLGRTMDRNMAKWLGGILMAIHALPSYSLA